MSTVTKGRPQLQVITPVVSAWALTHFLSPQKKLKEYKRLLKHPCPRSAYFIGKMHKFPTLSNVRVRLEPPSLQSEILPTEPNKHTQV